MIDPNIIIHSINNITADGYSLRLLFPNFSMSKWSELLQSKILPPGSEHRIIDSIAQSYVLAESTEETADHVYFNVTPEQTHQTDQVKLTGLLEFLRGETFQLIEKNESNHFKISNMMSYHVLKDNITKNHSCYLESLTRYKSLFAFAKIWIKFPQEYMNFVDFFAIENIDLVPKSEKFHKVNSHGYGKQGIWIYLLNGATQFSNSLQDIILSEGQIFIRSTWDDSLEPLYARSEGTFARCFIACTPTSQLKHLLQQNFKSSQLDLSKSYVSQSLKLELSLRQKTLIKYPANRVFPQILIKELTSQTASAIYNCGKFFNTLEDPALITSMLEIHDVGVINVGGEIAEKMGLMTQKLGFREIAKIHVVSFLAKSKDEPGELFFLQKDQDLIYGHHFRSGTFCLKVQEFSNFFSDTCVRVINDPLDTDSPLTTIFEDDDDETEKKSKKIIKKQLLKQLLNFLAENKGNIGLQFVFSIQMTIISFIPPFLIQYLLNHSNRTGTLGPIKQIIFAFLIISIFAGYFFYLNQKANAIVEKNFEVIANRSAFRTILNSTQSWIDESGVGIVFEWLKEMKKFKVLIFSKITGLINDLISICPTIIILFFYDSALGLALFSVLPLSFIFYFFYRNYVRKTLESSFQLSAITTNHLMDDLNRMQEVKTFSLEKTRREKHEYLALEFVKRQFSVEHSLNFLQQLTEGLFFLVFAFILVYSTNLASKALVSFGDLVAISLLTLRSQGAINSLAQSYEIYRHSRTRIKRILEMFLFSGSLKRKPNDGTMLLNLSGSLSFKNFRLVNETQSEQKFSKINLEVLAGEKLICFSSDPHKRRAILDAIIQEKSQHEGELLFDEIPKNKLNTAVFKRQVLHLDRKNGTLTWEIVFSLINPRNKSDKSKLEKCLTAVGFNQEQMGQLLLKNPNFASDFSQEEKLKVDLAGYLYLNPKILIFCDEFDLFSLEQQVLILKNISQHFPKMTVIWISSTVDALSKQSFDLQDQFKHINFEEKMSQD